MQAPSALLVRLCVHTLNQAFMPALVAIPCYLMQQKSLTQARAGLHLRSRLSQIPLPTLVTKA